MLRERLEDTLQQEHPQLMEQLEQDLDIEKVRTIFEKLALTPAPTGNIAELHNTVSSILQKDLQWDPQDYKLIMNPKGQITLIFGNYQRNDTFMAIVAHGDQITYHVDQKQRGYPTRFGRNPSKRYVQVEPTHKSHLRKGDSYRAAAFVYTPEKDFRDRVETPGRKTRGGFLPGVGLLTKGEIKCVADPRMDLERNIATELIRRELRKFLHVPHPPRDEGMISPYVFEYDGNLLIPTSARIIHDNEAYYNDANPRSVESACADDRAGVCSALLAANLLMETAKKHGYKIVVNLHADEEGPSAKGEHWSDDGLYSPFLAVMKNKIPAAYTIIIDGHTARNQTELGAGAFFCPRTGAGYGSRTLQGVDYFMELCMGSLQDHGIQLSLNKERVSRSSDVWLKFLKNVINIGFPLNTPHEMPEKVNLYDLVDVAKSVAFVTAAHGIMDIREQYLNLREDAYRS